MVTTDAACQAFGSTRVALQFEQTYFLDPEYLHGIVCQQETAIFALHIGQRKIFFIG
jgi:hypothetical protein